MTRSSEVDTTKLIKNLCRLVKYAEWQMREGGAYHPTLPSAVYEAIEAIREAENV